MREFGSVIEKNVPLTETRYGWMCPLNDIVIDFELKFPHHDRLDPAGTNLVARKFSPVHQNDF